MKKSKNSDNTEEISERELGVDEALLERAEAGEIDAQYQMGAELEKREFLFHAEKWYVAAARQGHPDAEFALGWLYVSGDDPNDQQYKRALELYRRSAEKGNANAQVALGASYAGIMDFCQTSCREVVPTDLRIAADWFHKAAVQGHPHGKLYFGCMCVDGEGVEKSLDEGLYWLFAAGEEVSNSRFQCWNASILRGFIPKALIPLYQSDAVENGIKRRIFDWLCKTADIDGADDLDYYACIGECLLNGYGTERDTERAIEYYLRAATSNGWFIVLERYDIERRLAICNEQGLGVERNPKEAFRWYSEAAYHGDPLSAEKVADCYEQGVVVKRDARKAANFRGYAEELRKSKILVM